ncbi:MAG: TonB-dependent receptor plug domain-containing protein [Candidatus Zixiibacteriota bacterium]|nr:MAG: TonB-dependent receptor plug domain-containing protein [candidate division Zixibacteria bacterium]
MKRIFSALVLAVFGAMGTGMAEDSADRENPRQLPDSIVVTANRIGVAAARSIWPVVVLDSDRLEAVDDIESGLDGCAGLDVRSYNGFGSLATLSNWGTFNRHMLLLYNGRAVKDYSLGGFNLADFSSDEIDRIEILKGPQSAFYGSDAVGGVVNLITRSSLHDRLELSVRRGSFDYGHYHLDFSRRLGTFGAGAFAEFSSTDNSRDNAGSRRLVLGVRADHLSSDGHRQAAFTARYFRDSLGVPGPQPDPALIPVYGSDESWSLFDHQQDENYSADFQYRFDHPVFGRARLDLFWEKKNLDYNSLYNYLLPYYPDDSTLYVDSVDVYSRAIFNKRSLGAGFRYARDSGPAHLAGGLDFLSGSVRATTDDRSFATNVDGPLAPYEYSFETYNYWRASQNQYDLWASAMFDLPRRFQADLSGRVQLVKDRRAQPSYNLGLIFSPGAAISFKIGYAFAFRLPTIVEQFAENVFTPGNSRLSAETSRSVIGTVNLAPGDGRFRSHLTVFHQTVDSLIQYQYDPASFHFVPRNVNRFRTTGIDLGARVVLKAGHAATLGGVMQKAEQTLAADGELVDAFYVPDIKYRFGLSGSFGVVNYDGSVTYTSRRSIIQADRERTIDPVYEINLAVSAALTEHLTASLSGYDLTDRQRPDQFGFSSADRNYPSPGRRFVLGVKYDLF